MFDQKLHRRSLRLAGYDYTQAGAYFVTICTKDRVCLFGEIVDGQMHLNEAGNVVILEWVKTGELRDDVEIDEFVVMPNHFHGIVVLHGGMVAEDKGAGTEGRGMGTEGRGTARRAPTMERFGAPVVGSIPTILRSFKSAVTKRINEINGTQGATVWQRNYYEHIIRNEESLNRIRQYIADNPAQWADDGENLSEDAFF